jgi:hypothetical protein
MSVTDSNKMENQQQQPSAETATSNAAVPSAPTAENTVKQENPVNGDAVPIKEDAPLAATTSSAPVMNGDAKPVDSNGTTVAAGSTVTPPIKTEAASGGADEEEEDDDAQSVKSEGADEEDALFTTLEKEEEQEEATHPLEQPKEATAAPKLLQKALVEGDVPMDDSEHGAAVAAADAAAKRDGEAGANEEDHHIHQRVSRFLVVWYLFCECYLPRNLQHHHSHLIRCTLSH